MYVEGTALTRPVSDLSVVIASVHLTHLRCYETKSFFLLLSRAQLSDPSDSETTSNRQLVKTTLLPYSALPRPPLGA